MKVPMDEIKLNYVGTYWKTTHLYKVVSVVYGNLAKSANRITMFISLVA